MWHQAKLKIRQIVYDDSGIAMAYTIVVFLVFFMICVATFAMSENIRQKMEMQNACDAAAYSAAVVQADMLARIAVLNRALSWTYFQTNKRHMDYVIDVWIDGVQRQWKQDHDTVNDFNARSCSPTEDPNTRAHNTARIEFMNYFATSLTGTYADFGVNFTGKSEDGSWSLAYLRRCYEAKNPTLAEGQSIDEYRNEISKMMFSVIEKGLESGSLYSEIDLNGTNRRASSIVSLRDYSNLAAAIDTANAAMEIMQNEMTYLRNNMNSHIQAAVKHTMDMNLPGISYKVLTGGNYFADVNDENALLAYTDTDESYFNNGYNTWWVKPDDSKIQRAYQSGYLWGKYNNYSTYWNHPDGNYASACAVLEILNEYTRTITPAPNTLNKPPVAISTSSEAGAGSRCLISKDLAGNTITEWVSTTFSVPEITPVGNSAYFYGNRVTGTSLMSAFFGKEGTIVVAAQTNAANPLSVLFGSAGIYTQSLYFGQTMTAVSAARAGIKLKGIGARDGEYSVFYPGDTTSSASYTDGVWNLCEDDWDAVMLPLNRAWCDAPANANGTFSAYAGDENGTTAQYSSDAILEAVYSEFGQNGSAPQGTDNFVWH